MVWPFNGKSKRKSRKKSRWKKRQSSAPRFEWATVWPIARPLVWLLAVVGLGYGGYHGYRYIEKQVGLTTAALPQVDFTGPPTWLGPARLAELQQVVSLAIDPNPLDQRSLAKAVASLESNPWIESVQRIHRAYDGRIQVQAQFRQPVALVRARDGYHLVDAQARRLPGVYPHNQLSSLGLPVISSVDAAPPKRGATWPGQDVQAGLRLAMFIGLSEFAEQVRRIDVANYAGRANPAAAHLVLHTDQGVIHWGRAPGDEGVHEPPAERKLSMLRQVAARYRGRADAGGQHVSVVHDVPLIRPRAAVRYTVGQ